MALTRKFLTALGIEADKVDEIIEAHADSINAIKAERDEYKDKASYVESLQKELDEAKATIDAQGKDEYQSKYEELKNEFSTYKADVEAKAILTAKDSAYRKLLKDVGVSEKRIDSIIKLTNLDEMNLTDEGFENAEKLEEAIKSEWADFIVESKNEGAGTDNPPANDGGNGVTYTIPPVF